MVRAVPTGRIVQVGMHRRSMPFVYEAKKLIDGGALGKVWQARAMWNWNFVEWLDNSPLEGKLDWERAMRPSGCWSRSASAGGAASGIIRAAT